MKKVLACSAAACIALSAPAQLTVSSVRGLIKDSAGLPVPHVSITLQQRSTGFTRTTESLSEGLYELPDLHAGTYVLTLRKDGFQTFQATVTLTGNEIRRIDASLRPGEVSTNVTVTETPAVISTEGAKQQATLTNKDYLQKPWIGNGINPLLLLTANPLVQNTGSIFGIQIAGLPNAQIQSTVDGIGGDSTLNGTNIHFYQEVNSVTGNNSAEFARAAQVNMISLGGTEHFHGLVQYWNQTSSLAAKDYFAGTKPLGNTHNMVAQLSGPVWRNHTYFLFTWEGQRIPASSYILQTVPTDPMRGGDFSQLLAQASPKTIKDPLTGKAFPNNVIPASRISPLAQTVMSTYIPKANTGAAGALSNNFGYTFPYPGDLFYLDNYMARIDQKFSSRNTAFVRWQFANVLYVLSGSYPSLFWTRVRHTYNFALEDTHTFSSRIVNTARFGLYNPEYSDGDTVDGKTPVHGNDVVQKIGLRGINSGSFPQAGFPNMAISGYSSVYEPSGGQGQDYKEWHYADTVTVALQRHLIRTGAELRSARQFNGAVPDGTFGSFSFNGSITGYGFADFLLGIPYSSSRVAPVVNRTQKDWELGLFVQDTFKVHPRLTLDLGLRWDRFGSANYADNLIYNWNPATNQVVVPQASLGKISPFFPTNLISVAGGEVRSRPSNANFVPRLGAAYRITPKTVVRGGYGIFNETLGRFARAQGGGPYQISETYLNLPTAGAYFSFPEPFPANGLATIPSQSVSGYPLDVKNGRIHEFNVTAERQMGSFGIRATYYGTRSVNMNYSLNVNKPQASLTAFTAARRPYPNVVSATYARTDGMARYNAGTVEVLRRSGALTLDAHYTLASNWNNMSNLEDPYATRRWGRDAATVRHRAVFNIGYEIPVGRSRRFFSGMNRWGDAALGGWRADWITYLESGQHFSPSFSGTDTSNTGTSGGFPDALRDGNLPASQRKPGRWFDATAFAVPQAGRFGNSPINQLVGPGLALNNLSVNKAIRFSESMRFSFGIATQNIFNHPNFAVPSANISAPGSVGVISSTRVFGGARQIMLRSRFEF